MPGKCRDPHWMSPSHGRMTPGRLDSITSIADDAYIAFQMSSKHAAINIYELLLSTRFAPHQQLSARSIDESSLR